MGGVFSSFEFLILWLDECGLTVSVGRITLLCISYSSFFARRCVVSTVYIYFR
jgi:hypothetical protein